MSELLLSQLAEATASVAALAFLIWIVFVIVGDAEKQ